MSANPILVRNIHHLTDARYFAAMEVDWISLELSNDSISFSKWHAMRDWISGLKFAAELKEPDESLVAKTIIDARPDGIISDSLDFVHLTGGVDLFILTEKLLPVSSNHLYAQIIPYDPLNFDEGVLTFEAPALLYIEADWTTELISELKDINYSGGFCFRTVSEEIVGVKDYAAMDEMIALIRQ